MKKFASAFLITALMAVLAQAHEFWMQPDKFRYAVGETVRLNFMVGENFVGERWKLNPQRFLRLDHHAVSYSGGLIEQLNTGEGNNLEVKLAKAGSHLFVMQSTNAFIELEATEFNDYLKEDGLEDVLAFRQKNNLMEKAGKEFYARCTKLLVQAGPNSDETYKKVVGMPLEIVPLNDPYRA